MHRDAVAARFARGVKPAYRLDDGTLVVEDPTFDPISGRVDTTWYWSGPDGQGSKSASLRMYTVTGADPSAAVFRCGSYQLTRDALKKTLRLKNQRVAGVSQSLRSACDGFISMSVAGKLEN